MNLGTSNITYDSHKKKERKKLLQPKPKVLFRGAFVLFWVGHLGWFFFTVFSKLDGFSMKLIRRSPY